MTSMTRATAASRRAGLLAVAALALLLTGCGGQPKGTPLSAMERYEQRDYSGALREAQSSYRASSGVDRDRAALVAGMSAYELRRWDEADKWLRPITSSADAEVAGRASATLGLTNAARNNFAAAAIDFSSAGRKLSGDDAARANFYAGECYGSFGRVESAKRAYTAAEGQAEDPALSAKIRERLAASGYTVQLGAYADMGNASSIADKARNRASSRGLPAPAVVSSTDVTGRTLYLVQVGKWATREEALAARSRLGGEGVVVAAR